MANVEKIQELIDVLEWEAEHDRLDMATWATTDGRMVTKDSDCGFTACAAGWTLLLEGFSTRSTVGYLTFWNEDERLNTHAMIGNRAAEILGIAPAFDGRAYPNEHHIFFQTEYDNSVVIEGFKHLLKGDSMDEVHYDVFEPADHRDDCQCDDCQFDEDDDF